MVRNNVERMERTERKMKEYIVTIEDNDSDFDEMFIGGIRKAYPELIRCKDCIHFKADDLETYCPLTGMYSLDVNHYCAWAERKQNGIQD